MWSSALKHYPSTWYISGVYEALEFRDGGSDFMGKGVLKAVTNVNDIIGPALVGKDPTQQTEIDNFMVQKLDGTVNEWGWCKQKLGANAILAVSLAVCKAGAQVKKIPLYKHIAELAGNKKMVLPVPAGYLAYWSSCYCGYPVPQDLSAYLRKLE